MPLLLRQSVQAITAGSAATYALALALLSRHLLNVLIAASTHSAAKRLRLTPALTQHTQTPMLSQLLHVMVLLLIKDSRAQ
jgi:hypothetical protein